MLFTSGVSSNAAVIFMVLRNHSTGDGAMHPITPNEIGIIVVAGLALTALIALIMFDDK
jgi:hypothetical protein